MKLSDEFDGNNKDIKYGFSTARMLLWTVIGMGLIVVFVLYMNKDRLNTPIDNDLSSSDTINQDSYNIDQSAITADELDIWTVPSDESEDENSSEDENDVPLVDEDDEETDSDSAVKNPENTDTTEDTFATDGKHTLVINPDGTEDWITISSSISKNEYDFSKLKFSSPIMQYIEDGNVTSFVGVDISKEQGFVDFNKLKKAGISFAMIRLGLRGYGTGQLVLDDYFAENTKNAQNAGVHIGVYFYSQAITEEEAIEEANMVITNLADKTVAYPVAFVLEQIQNDTARTDGLTRNQKTKIADAFLSTIKAAGYDTIIYGTKEFLIKQIDLSKLKSYDVWLAQEMEEPDFPYRFSMWQYSTQLTIDGIARKANLNISFIDYEKK